MRALVIPTCRPESFSAWADAWRGLDADLLIVVNGGERPIGPPGICSDEIVVRREHVSADLRGRAWIISEHDSACRSYGYYLAWKEGADVTGSLDDDCRPADGGTAIMAGHEAAMKVQGWFDTLPAWRVRGTPYLDRGRIDSSLNMGLWCGTPDLDAITTLAHGRREVRSENLPRETRLVPKGQYFPLCGMNFSFLRELTPLMYFGLQGHPWPFARFDDVWCGVIAKKICDHLGLSITVGEPVVHHTRASDTMTNLVKEAPGIAFHERFWRMIDDCSLTRSQPAECFLEIADQLPRADVYLGKLAEAMRLWAEVYA